MRRSVTFAIISAALAVMLASGIRASFGLLQLPLVEALNTNRETYSLAIAISNLVYGIPLVGILADRIGSRWVILAGGIAYVGGLLMLTRIVSVGGMILSLGLVIGLALSATTYVVVLGAVAKLVPPEQHSRAFGIITAAGSSGMFVVPPIAQLLIDRYEWRNAMMVLALLASVIIVLGFVMPSGMGKHQGAPSAAGESFVDILRKARGHTGYMLLILGFFVCGFHVSFIGTHLPAYLSDNGLDPLIGATALSLVGVFNIVGSTTFGFLGDFLRKKHLLSLIYLGRSIVIVLFIAFPITRLTALVFAGAMGFLWLATVPLTSGMVSQIFGSRYMSTLYGVVFFSHQVGAFLGVWLGGRLFDTLGTYQPVWYIAIVLGLVAAVAHLPINDAPAVSQAAA